MSKRYEVTGIPISPPFDVLAGRAVGDKFTADIDADIERLLIGGGALRIIEEEPPRQRDKKQEPVSKESQSWPEPESSRAPRATGEASSRSRRTTSRARNVTPRES